MMYYVVDYVACLLDSTGHLTFTIKGLGLMDYVFCSSSSILDMYYVLCCQLFCTIVGLAKEPPFGKHDKCLCSSVSDDSPLCLASFG